MRASEPSPRGLDEAGDGEGEGEVVEGEAELLPKKGASLRPEEEVQPQTLEEHRTTASVQTSTEGVL